MSPASYLAAPPRTRRWDALYRREAPRGQHVFERNRASNLARRRGRWLRVGRGRGSAVAVVRRVEGAARLFADALLDRVRPAF